MKEQYGTKIVINGSPEPGRTVLIVNTLPSKVSNAEDDSPINYHYQLVNELARFFMDERGINIVDITTSEFLLTNVECGIE